MSIFELTLEDTLARKNSNKICFFTANLANQNPNGTMVQWYTARIGKVLVFEAKSIGKV